MILKKGDFVELEYSAKLKETGELFDSTDEKVAKEKDFYSEQGMYGPIIIKLGEGQVLKGLEDELVGKALGQHVVTLPPAKAFGHKDAKLVQLIPLKRFHEHRINPVPGLRLNIDGLVGLVRATSGGRVLVDFNHPLSGKEVVYDVHVKRIVQDSAERVKAMLRLAHLEPKNIEARDGKTHITLAQEVPAAAADRLAEKLAELIGSPVHIEHKEEKKGDVTSAAGPKA